MPTRAAYVRSVCLVSVALGLWGCKHKETDKAVPASSATASAALSATAAPKACPDGMIEIPGGKFFMGSDDDEALEFEKPSHNVTLAPYCIDKFEVTTALYKKCVDRGACTAPTPANEWKGIAAKERKAFDPLCNYADIEGHGNHPINCVEWSAAERYCTAIGGRLPTEAEWEFATRGSDGRAYSWGDQAPSGKLLNACGKECVAWGKKNKIEETAMYEEDDGWPTTAPVGSFPGGASRFGLQDVVGNVWEWVADYYAPYTSSPQVDPPGPPEGAERVIRGGAWNGAYPAWVRPTFRYHDIPTKRSYGIGFRCAASRKG